MNIHKPLSPMYKDASSPIAEQFKHSEVPSPPLTAEVQKAYDKYLADCHGDLTDTAHLAATMFNAGGRTAVTAMVTFGDIVPQLHRIEAKVKALLELLDAFS